MRPRRLSTGGGSFVGSFVGALWTLLFLPLEGLGRASVGIGYCCPVPPVVSVAVGPGHAVAGWRLE
jgi:hypothetical protein